MIYQQIQILFYTLRYQPNATIGASSFSSTQGRAFGGTLCPVLCRPTRAAA